MRLWNTYKFSIWRVPLIYLLAGFAFVPIYTNLAIALAGMGMDLEHGGFLLTRTVLFLVLFFLGGILLLRHLTRKEILISASVVAFYGALLALLQQITGSTTGSAGMVFLHLHRPLEWTLTPSIINFFHDHNGLPILWLCSLQYFEPLLFVVFGRQPNNDDGER